MKKQNKKSMVIVAVAVVCIIFGSIFIGAGLIKGGSLRYLSINSDTVSWWPFEGFNMGISFGDEMNREDQRVSFSENLDQVSSLNLAIDIGEVELRRGTENRVSFASIKKEYVTIQNSEGNVDITIKRPSVFHNSKNGRVIVYLRDKVYDSIHIESNIGEISMDNIRAKRFNVQAKLGEIDMQNIYSEELIVDQKCGDIDVSGELLGASRINNKLGDTDIEIHGAIGNYRYDVKNSLGDTTVQHEEMNGRANLSRGNSDAKNNLRVESSLGDIDIEFR